MLNCLVIGDPHFKINNTEQMTFVTTAILNLARELRPSFIVCLGDVLDRHANIDLQPLIQAEAFLGQLRDIAPTYVLIGNHDRPNNSVFLTNEHPFNALKEWSGITIVDQVSHITIQDRAFIFAPYVPPGRFDEALHTSVTDEQVRAGTAIFAHQEFRGAKMGGIISEEGDVWPTDYPLVISGHIHDFDYLQNNIIYVGTPIQHAHGDGDRKVVMTFDFGTPITHKTYDLGCPKLTTVRLTYDEALSYDSTDLNQLTRVAITGTAAEIKDLHQRGIISELEDKRAKIKINRTTITTPAIVGGKTFLERLQSKLQGMDDVLSCLREALRSG